MQRLSGLNHRYKVEFLPRYIGRDKNASKSFQIQTHVFFIQVPLQVLGVLAFWAIVKI